MPQLGPRENKALASEDCYYEISWLLPHKTRYEPEEFKVYSLDRALFQHSLARAFILSRPQPWDVGEKGCSPSGECEAPRPQRVFNNRELHFGLELRLNETRGLYVCAEAE